MATTEVTLALPDFLADRLAADAASANLPLERHLLQVLFADALRVDAERHRAWALANPEAVQREQREEFLAEVEREVAQLVDDGMPVDEAEQVAARTVAEFELTFTPGYLDPSNDAIPMTAERHIAILRATMRAQQAQDIAVLDGLAARYAEGGDQAGAARFRAQAARLRSLDLP